MIQKFSLIGLIFIGLIISSLTSVNASSHREAPFITEHPKVDGTDFYMFRSFEAGRDTFVTLIYCFNPLQPTYGGPNYFTPDPNALYEIMVDNDGDALEDITFQFRFTVTVDGIFLNIGGTNVSVPVFNVGTIDTSEVNMNVIETYTMRVVRGDRRTGTVANVSEVGTSALVFTKPADNVGTKSIPNYNAYASNFIYDINLPTATGSSVAGRLFVGQRDDPFYVNLGRVFDLINITNPASELAADNEPNIIDEDATTAIVLEVPITYLTENIDPVIGSWATSSLRQGRLLNPSPVGANNASVEGGAWVQVSRLGHPLINEVIIGLPDKDRFNASEPFNDTQFLTYVTNPTLPAIVNLLFPALPAPATTPRNDLVDVFLTGLAGLNQPALVTASEMLRLNTTTPVVALGLQDPLGVINGDNAGFPNGRRPIDDVVDIELRVAYGLIAVPAVVTELTDGCRPVIFVPNTTAVFPYLLDPIPGSF